MPWYVRPRSPSPYAGRGVDGSTQQLLTPLSRADRKIIGSQAAGPCVGEVPPLAGIVCKSLFAHRLDQHVAPALLFGTHSGARRVACGIKAVEARPHVDAVVGAAPSGGGGTGSVSGRRIERRSRRRVGFDQRQVDGVAARMLGPRGDIA